MNRLDLRPWQARWEQLSTRERTWVSVAAGVLVLALLWQVGLAPALRVWRESPARHAELDRQQAQLAALQAQARSLQTQPTLSRQEAQQSLAQLTRDLLPGAQLSAMGDQQRVTLKNVSGTSLAQWLSAVRSTAQASVLDLRLQRSPTSPETPAQWDGQVTLQLPVRGAP
jgi:general secretion pathway protein M